MLLETVVLVVSELFSARVSLCCTHESQCGTRAIPKVQACSHASKGDENNEGVECGLWLQTIPFDQVPLV